MQTVKRLYMSINDIEAVKNIIENTENNRTEFKETTGQLERGMETICAFLNGTGGTVLFGITDKGKIIGQEVADTTKRNIAEAINRLEPTASVQVSYVPMPDSNKKIIALHTEEARYERPFCYKGRAYMRLESVTTTMPQAVYNELLLKREGTRRGWDSYFDENLKLSDLDDEEIRKTVRLGIECGRLPETTDNKIPVILGKLGLLENNKLKQAAAVLFANRKMPRYPQCLLRLARFKGTDKMVFMDNQRIHGNIFQLIDAAMSFVFKHLSLSGTTETLEREEHLTIPYKAIREGIVNSLCHRCYREPGGSVAIAIYDDRVEIENPGALPNGWDMEKLKDSHDSNPQNPLIADVLYIRKVLESWGRGISLIMEECQKVNLPEPEYEAEAGSIKLIFRYGTANRISTTYVPHKHRISSVQVSSLIKAIDDGSYSVLELMEMLNLKSRSYFAKDYLKPSIEEGLIEPIYPDQPKSPKQKYRLTDKGKELLKQ